MKNISNFNKRKQRVRSSIRKKSSLPRLSIFISNKNIYAFVIDNFKNDTVCSTSTKSLKISGSNIDSATKVGEKIAQEAIKKKITNVVFDKGAYLYHGKVKALSDAARNKGLIF
jgi:large subunit ribosomal protein L18